MRLTRTSGRRILFSGWRRTTISPRSTKSNFELEAHNKFHVGAASSFRVGSAQLFPRVQRVRIRVGCARQVPRVKRSTFRVGGARLPLRGKRHCTSLSGKVGSALRVAYSVHSSQTSQVALMRMVNPCPLHHLRGLKVSGECNRLRSLSFAFKEGVPQGDYFRAFYGVSFRVRRAR